MLRASREGSVSWPAASGLASAPSSAERSSGPQVMPISRALASRKVPARNNPAADSTACARILIPPSGRPAMASRAVSLASRCTTLAPPSAFGNTMASGRPATTASRSASIMPVSRPLMRTKRRGRGFFVCAALRNSNAAVRACALRSGVIESSRSRITASAPLAIALSSLAPPSAGTNKRERIMFAASLRPHDDEGVAVAFGHQRAVLLERLVMEFDDTGARARLRRPLAHDHRRAIDGVALEQRIGEFYVGHAEIGDRGADRHVGDLDAAHQAEREQRVHQRLAPLGLGLAEMPVDVQWLRVERHVGEQHVVHLGDGAPVAVLVQLADLEVLEIEPAALVPLDRIHHRCPPHLVAAAVNHSFTIIIQDRQSSRMSVSGLAIFSARDLEARLYK